MIFGCGGGHIGFKKNANGRNFAHPLKNIVLGLYKLESIDKKSLYSNSTLCVISSWLIQLQLCLETQNNQAKIVLFQG